MNCARVVRPSFRVLVMQYIQRCGGSGLVLETGGGGGGVDLMHTSFHYSSQCYVNLDGE